ncbi:MAG: LacI family DNA-binding transcriptional regulator [Saprospiraceae bacterium]|nr:LacI family DNA-binding transcriptional regulator [Saprospiraceae bacterium]
MEKEVTIYDIAKELNVSAATVSRALNGHTGISEKKKVLIQSKADELGYRSNKFAINLRQQKTYTIGVIVPRLNSYFMSAVLAGMEKIANEAGYNLLISQSLESEKKEIINAQTLFNSRVDALLVSIASDTEGVEHFKNFIDKGVPILFFDRIPQHLNCTTIAIDNKKAGYEATKHLIEQDCTRILHAAGSLKRNVYRDRLEGYKIALAEQGIPFNEDLIFESYLTQDAAAQLVTKILDMPIRPNGLFTSNDNFAVHTIKLLKNNGLRIPEDIAIVGFNDDPIASVIEPNLTTIHYAGKEMGEIAAQSIINHLNGLLNITPTNTIILHSKLIIRESSLKKGTTHTHLSIDAP